MRQLNIGSAWLLIMVLVIQMALPIPSVQAEDDVRPPERDGWVLLTHREHLIYMNKNQEEYLTANIRLLASVDLSGYDWQPFGGNGIPPFNGVFDGNGFLISGISVTGNELESAGFFGSSSGTIRNLGVEGQIRGGHNAGILAGLVQGGSIDRSYSLGSVESGSSPGAGLSLAGGLVGLVNYGLVTRSYSTADVVVGATGNMYAGGLVGSMGNSSIEDAYARGSISNRIHNERYALRSAGVSGNIVNGTGTRIYATGAIDQSTNTNALFSYYGGLTADFFVYGDIQQSFFDAMTTGAATGVATEPNSVSMAKTTAEMHQQSTYVGWDFATTWVIHPDINDGYPYLRPAVLTEELPQALKGEQYEVQLTAFDGAGGGLTWNATSLPDGLELTASGLLRGIPETGGAFVVSVTAEDSGSASAEAALQLVVTESAPDIAAFEVRPGAVIGSVVASGERADSLHNFAYLLSDVAIDRPMVGDALPAEAMPYVTGDDITGVAAAKFLSLYETDGSGLIKAWSSVQLEESHIRAAIRVTGIRVEPAELTLTAGDSPQRVTATIEPANADNEAVSWSSEDPEIVTVDQAGEIMPLTPGTAKVTAEAMDGGHTAEVTVTVQARPPVPEPAPDIATFEVRPGAVIGSVAASGERVEPLHSFAYLLSDVALERPMVGEALPAEAVAYTADEDITGVAAGQYLSLYVTDGSGLIQAWSSIQLEELHIRAAIRVTGIRVEPADLTLTAGDPPQRVTVTIEPANADNQAVSWSSEDPEVAMVNQAGEITPLAPGTATVTVETQDGGHTAEVTVTVQARPPVTGSIAGTVHDSGGNPIPGAAVTVDGESMVVTASDGTFQITNLRAATVSIQITAPGYQPVTRTVDITAGALLELGRIELARLQTDGGVIYYPPVMPPAPQTQSTTLVSVNGSDTQVTFTSSQTTDGRYAATLTFDEAQVLAMLNLLEGDRHAIIEMDRAESIVLVELPAATLRRMWRAFPDGTIEIRVNGAGITLPLALVSQDSSSEIVTLRLAKLTDEEETAAKETLSSLGLRPVSEIAELSILLDGATAGVYGDRYIAHRLTLDAPNTSSHLSVVRIGEEGQHLHRTPSELPNGADQISFFSLQSGVFTVVESLSVFTDWQHHWAGPDIGFLTGTRVWEIDKEDSLAPDAPVSRATFTTLLVRALGLPEMTGLQLFHDVEETDPLIKVYNAAWEAGLISGYDDGAFRPEMLMTREEMAVMMARALAFIQEHGSAVGLIANERVAQADVAAQLADAEDIAFWARAAINELYTAKIIIGMPDGAFAPKQPATNAQAVVMLRRLLQHFSLS
ncbi:Ig-like domain-containing protein [Paenibacillus daejeonensis]|uniref:Ig-like domain-containing protein n=1 Tax=Paenibacillus daejeonensis TaxID=135193 RepID=UPI0003A0B528|nr:Ig-like domain-containing protein [Paenibacillus daejeonensis]